MWKLLEEISATFSHGSEVHIKRMDISEHSHNHGVAVDCNLGDFSDIVRPSGIASWQGFHAGELANPKQIPHIGLYPGQKIRVELQDGTVWDAEISDEITVIIDPTIEYESYYYWNYSIGSEYKESMNNEYQLDEVKIISLK
jgi:hypothetical protein